MKRIQSHPGTLTLRHTTATEMVVRQLRPLGRDARLLVFGCSWGAEIVPFAASLREARILGVEIEERAINDAQALLAGHANVSIEMSNWQTIAAHAPYDAILCNAVLCRYPNSKTATDLNGLFPFEEFANMASQLDAHLKPGGILTVYNANYSVTDCEFASDYVPVPLPPSMSYFPFDNFVSQFSKDGRKIIHVEANGPSYFVDVPEDLRDKTRFVAERLNEGLFIKSPSERAGLKSLEMMSVFASRRTDFASGIAIPLERVYRSTGAAHPGYCRVPMEQIVRRLQAGEPGNPMPVDCYEFTYWWGEQLLSVPRLMPVDNVA